MNLKQHISHPIFQQIASESEKMNTQSYVIGGFVRDVLLKRTSKDIDVVTVGNGIELATAVGKVSKSSKVAVFKRFGTAMIKSGNLEIEFVGARKESYRSESRKPEVKPGTLQEDQNRRDFTINAMSISLQASNFGDLIDPFNGVEDLKKKIIRTPLNPNITYSDDPLRMMRAIRFATQLDFQIEEKSLAAITKNKERIKIVSQERITGELNKIILAKNPSKGFKLLYQTGLLQLIFPLFCKLKGIEFKEGKGHKDNFYHTLEVLDNISVKTNDLWLRWAAILHDIAKPATKRFNKKNGWTFHGHEDLGARWIPEIFKKLRLPLDHKMKYVQKLVRLHLRPIALVKNIVTDSGVRRLLFDANEDIEDLLTLCNADITSKNEQKVRKYKQNFVLVKEKLKIIEEKDKIRNFQPPITGEIIIETFDLKPCREIGVIKTKIKDAILDGEIENDFEQAYQLMLTIGKSLKLKETPLKN